MTSIQPTLSHIRAELSRPAQRALDRVTLDDVTPDRITAQEMDAMVRSLSFNDMRVFGDDLTPRELRDLQTIRKLGAWLMPDVKARQGLDVRLMAARQRANLELRSDDAGLKVRQAAVDTILIRGTASGQQRCPPGAMCIGGPSTVAITVGGETFRVHPKLNETRRSVAERLAAELEAAGYPTQLAAAPGGCQLKVRPRPAPTINITDRSTDPRVSVAVQGPSVLFSFDSTKPAEPGHQVGIEVNGKVYSAASKGKAHPLQLIEPALRRDGWLVTAETLRSGSSQVTDIAWTLSRAESILDRGHAVARGHVKYYPAGQSPGRANSDGAWLELARPMLVEGQLVREVYLGDQGTAAGTELELHGRFDLRKGQHASFVALTGRTVPSKGEPSFDGVNFTSVDGQALPHLTYYGNPMIADLPSLLLVPDPKQKALFFGHLGGFIPSDGNPFGGFQGRVEVTGLTLADSAKASWPLGAERPHGPSGPLARLGTAEGGPSWWLDRDSKTAWRFETKTVDGQTIGLLKEKADLSGLDSPHLHDPFGG